MLGPAGGLGKMPGIYFTAESSRVAHVAAKLEDAVGRALAVGKAEKEQMIKVGSTGTPGVVELPAGVLRCSPEWVLHSIWAACSTVRK